MRAKNNRVVEVQRTRHRFALLRRVLWSCLLGAVLLLPAMPQRPMPPAEEPPAPKLTPVELRKMSFKEAKKEAEGLLKAAAELRKALEKSGDTPRNVIAEKSVEIEKRAKRIQSKLRGF